MIKNTLSRSNGAVHVRETDRMVMNSRVDVIGEKGLDAYRHPQPPRREETGGMYVVRGNSGGLPRPRRHPSILSNRCLCRTAPTGAVDEIRKQTD